MIEETENKENLYIVKTMHNDSFYKAGVCYTTDLYEAKFYNSDNEIPQELKDNPNLKIININSEEGLEILVSEFKKAERYLSIKSQSFGEAMTGRRSLMNLLRKFGQQF
jgi:hypothetical protein